METLVHRNSLSGSVLLISSHRPIKIPDSVGMNRIYQFEGTYNDHLVQLPSNFSWVPSLCRHQYSARSATKTKVKACYSILLVKLWMGLRQRQLWKKDYSTLGTNYCIRHQYLTMKRKEIYFHHRLFHTWRFSKGLRYLFCSTASVSTSAGEGSGFAGEGWLEKCHEDPEFLLTEE